MGYFAPIYQLYITALPLVLDPSCLSTVFKGVERLFVESHFWGNAGYHDGFGVAS
jgi:hypothetical protein